MNIKRLSDEGAKEVLAKVLGGIQEHADRNECHKEILQDMKENFLDPLAEDDYFGTEGWEAAFGLDD
jgi:hypothetical protein